jgi:antitoxin component of RelBE/YafQ-DinJ toxin-antitoxin module
MVKKPKTQRRSIRIDDKLWSLAERIAAAEFVTPSHVIRTALRRLAAEHLGKQKKPAKRLEN